MFVSLLAFDKSSKAIDYTKQENKKTGKQGITHVYRISYFERKMNFKNLIPENLLTRTLLFYFFYFKNDMLMVYTE